MSGELRPRPKATNETDSVTVDFVAKSGDCWLLVLVESGPWTEPIESELRRLQNRLYGCLDAALEGLVASRFPESKGKAIRIRVDGYNLPRSEVTAFFQRFAALAPELPDYAQALRDNQFIGSLEFELNLDEAH